MQVISVLLVLVLVPPVALAYLQIQDLAVKPSTFSPDGDGILDSAEVAFKVITDEDYASVSVDVLDRQDTLIRRIAQEVLITPGTISFWWDGCDDEGKLVPEATYRFSVRASAGAETTSTYMIDVVVDVTPPTFSALIFPNPYAPDTSPYDSLLTIEVEITQCSQGDLLEIHLSGNGESQVLCIHSLSDADTTLKCLWDGRQYEDGVYSIVITASDLAGNSTSASYAIDLDLEPPLIEFTHPKRTRLNAFPDSLSGIAFDRNQIDTLRIRFYEDTPYQQLTFSCMGDTALWAIAWPGSLIIEGQFQIQCYAVDGVGHSSVATLEVLVDTTSPPPPVFDIPQERTNRPYLTLEGSCHDADSVYVYLNNDLYSVAKCSPQGSFTLTVELELGINTIYGISKDVAGNFSAPSDTLRIEYFEEVGINVPELFKQDSVMEINLSKPASSLVIHIYTIEGQEVRTLRVKPDLYNEIPWDLNDSDGSQVRNGVYVIVFDIKYADGTGTITKRAVVVSR